MQDSSNGHAQPSIHEENHKPLRRAENLLRSNGQPIKELATTDDAANGTTHDKPPGRRKTNGNGVGDHTHGLGIGGSIGASIKRRLTTLKDRSRAFALGRSHSTGSHPKTTTGGSPSIKRAFTDINAKVVEKALANDEPGFRRSRHSVGSAAQVSGTSGSRAVNDIDGKNVGRNMLWGGLQTMSEHPVQDDERTPCPGRPSLGVQSVSTVVPSPSSPSDNPPENLTHDPLSTCLTVPRLPRRLSSVQVPESLQNGTIMTKVSMKKQKAFLFRLDADLGQIVWESKKYKIIPIENIKEIRLGVDSRFYRAQFQLPSNVEDRWLTVIYVLDGRYRTLHLMAQTAEICQMWENSLKELHSIRLLLMRGLGNAEMRESLWVKQYWIGADEEGDQKLSFDEVVKFCRGLGINSSEEDLERGFVHASQGKPYLDFEDFRAFVKLLKSRPEVERLYKKLISRSESEVFDFDVFQSFMRNTQRSYLPDADLQAIFDKHSVYPSAAVKNPTSTSIVVSPPNEITKSSSSSNHAATTSKPTMTLETFTAFLLSSENSAYSDVHRGIWHDMTRPLCEYFISSSHNTYLVGHQLVGESTIEGYIRALLQGCRSVEVDIYDGDNGPMIFHGKTLTSKVSLREVCHAIIKYGFVASPYPIIISAEVHCSVPQQELIAEIMIEVFGDALVRSISDAPGPTTGLESVKVQKIESLPSPEELKGKILLKTKNLMLQRFPTTDGNVDQAHPADVTDFYSTEPSSTSDSEMGTRKMRGRGVKHLSESASGSMSPTPTVVPNLPVITQETPKKEKGKSKSEDGGVKGQLSRAGASFLGKVRGVGRSSSLSLPIKIRGHRSSGSTATIATDPAIGLSQSPPVMSPAQLVQSPDQQSESSPPSSFPFHSTSLLSASGSSVPTASSINATLNIPTPASHSSSTSKPKPKMSPNLVSLLVYTVGVRFRGLNKKEYYAPEHMFSLSENVVNRMIARSPSTYEVNGEHAESDVTGMGTTTTAPATEDEGGVANGTAVGAGYALRVAAMASPRTAARSGRSMSRGRADKGKESLGSGGAWDLIKHTRTHLVRIYPKGTRLNSSNYLPNKFWAVGAQLVALNWQTFDLGFTINQAMFLRNGRSGYVLKPAVLRPQVIPTYPPHHRECVDHSPSRRQDQHQHLAHHHLASHLHLHKHHSPYPLTNKELLATRTWYHLDITIISAQQLPRPKDASGREVPGRAIVDPYVEVTVHVPDGPLVQKGSGGGSGSGGLGAGLSLKRGRSRSRPRDISVDRKRSTSRNPQSGHAVKANGATPSFMVDDKGTLDLHSAHQPEPNGSSAAASVHERVVTKHTGVVKRNGFNPVWEEKLRLTFDCVGDMLDLAFVRFAVKQEDGAKHETDEGLAVYCAPVGCLGMGYRHLPLHDSQLSQYLYSTLFVKINLSRVGEGEQCD
ncbi:hypothetical protein BJ165DRAFT_1611178 [Panaeolus papilionaceus]|nr:hypothetical protein BJ165DRAFT_1611178 [Panaeolus papilionaceus]